MDDLISRQAAIDAIKDFKKGAAEWRDEQEECSDIWHRADSAVASALEIGLRIRKLPAAPERKTGKWVLTEDDNYEYCTCSECGYQNGENWMIGSDIPFCANCGADMRGEEDAETH